MKKVSPESRPKPLSERRSMPLSHAGKNRIALAAICLIALMFGLEISSVPVILPTLEKELHGDSATCSGS